MKMTLRAWRRAKGKTIAEMARWLDVHPNTYQKWEESPGKISIDKAIEIADYLQISLDDIDLAPESTKLIQEAT